MCVVERQVRRHPNGRRDIKTYRHLCSRAIGMDTCGDVERRTINVDVVDHTPSASPTTSRPRPSSPDTEVLTTKDRHGNEHRYRPLKRRSSKRVSFSEQQPTYEPAPPARPPTIRYTTTNTNRPVVEIRVPPVAPMAPPPTNTGIPRPPNPYEAIDHDGADAYDRPPPIDTRPSTTTHRLDRPPTRTNTAHASPSSLSPGSTPSADPRITHNRSDSASDLPLRNYPITANPHNTNIKPPSPPNPERDALRQAMDAEDRQANLRRARRNELDGAIITPHTTLPSPRDRDRDREHRERERERDLKYRRAAEAEKRAHDRERQYADGRPSRLVSAETIAALRGDGENPFSPRPAVRAIGGAAGAGSGAGQGGRRVMVHQEEEDEAESVVSEARDGFVGYGRDVLAREREWEDGMEGPGYEVRTRVTVGEEAREGARVRRQLDQLNAEMEDMSMEEQRGYGDGGRGQVRSVGREWDQVERIEERRNGREGGGRRGGRR